VEAGVRLGPFDLRWRSDPGPVTVGDWQERARRRLPSMIWAYVENGADRERSLRANEEAFRLWQLRPRVLAGVAEVDLSSRVAGVPLELPVLLAPLGLAGALHWRGEVAAARAAERAGTRLVLSTGSSYSLEEVSEAADEHHFFQLYPWGDRSLTGALIDRASDAGYAAMFVTVDVPVVGNRLGERRFGMGIPPVVTPARVARAVTKPRWSYGYVRHRRVSLQNLATPGTRGSVLATAQRQAVNMRPDLAWSDLAWMRERWPGPLFVKGILGVEDAARALEHGADGIVVSNHGGRQLDGCPAPLDVLPEVVAAVQGRAQVLIDGGVRSGSDVAVALALGADAVLIGRPQAYGLAAAGEGGVTGVLGLLRKELQRTLHLMGVASVRHLCRGNLIGPEPIRKPLNNFS
jgi:L-lactate dehydrogenase (cytochrome)/(S)-mandelate dehydrogenase